MKIACLMPTYGRPTLVANALACFQAQTHPASDRRLLILDDAGQISGESDGWKIWSTATRYPSITAKYAAMIDLLNAWWPEWEALALMDDDDIYGPEWLSSHAAALRDHSWSYPTNVWSLYGRGTQPGGKMPMNEPSAGRFWASAAVRRDLFERAGRFIQTEAATFDQQHLALWRRIGGEPGRPDQNRPSQYVYGWGRSKHCSLHMGSADWYQRHVKTTEAAVAEFVPRSDSLTRWLWSQLWHVNIQGDVLQRLPEVKRIGGRPRVGIVTPALASGGAEQWMAQLLTSTSHAIDWRGVWLAGIGSTEESCVERFRRMTRIYGLDRDPAGLLDETECLLIWGMVEEIKDLLVPWLKARRSVIVSHAHGWNESQRLVMISRSFCHWAETAIRQSLPFATDYVAVSRSAVRPFLGQVDPGRVRVIHNGIDTARLSPGPGREATRTRLGFEPGDFVVGSIGRLSREKRLDVLIEATASADGPVKLLLVGDGPESEKLRAAAAKRLPGRCVFLPTTLEIGPLLAAMDCAVLASPAEGFCFAAVESLWAGVPLVASPVGVLPEIAEQFGRLWQEIPLEADAAEIAAAIAAVRGMPPEDRVAQAELARRAVESEYTVDQFGWRWIAYLYHLLRPCQGIPAMPAMPATLAPAIASVALACSVVIPVYNTPPRWLEECLQSVLTQEGVAFEVVVVDDGSTDPDTIRCLQALSHRPQVRLFRADHQGTAMAVQLGAEVSRGQVIVRIDSDDVMLPGRLAEQVAWLAEHPEIAVVAGTMDLIDEDGNPRGETVLPVGELADPYWRYDWRLCTPTVAMRRQAVLDAGPARPIRPDDYDLWCRLSRTGARLYSTDRRWVRYRIHSGQASADPQWAGWHRRIAEEYRREAEEQGQVKPGPDGQPTFGGREPSGH